MFARTAIRSVAFKVNNEEKDHPFFFFFVVQRKVIFIYLNT
jgi:hypothetical protein